MAKGAANEQALGGLHAKITAVFSKVLDRYEARLDHLDGMKDREAIENDILEELFTDNALPNPAMLSAVSKFLKDNDIGLDTEQIAQLSDQERRLKERRDRRGNVVALTTLPTVAHG